MLAAGGLPVLDESPRLCCEWSTLFLREESYDVEMLLANEWRILEACLCL